MILGLPLLPLFVRLSAFTHDGNANEAAQMPIVLRKVRLVVREVLNRFFSVQLRLSFDVGGDIAFPFGKRLGEFLCYLRFL